jgi:hypothetical protein
MGVMTTYRRKRTMMNAMKKVAGKKKMSKKAGITANKNKKTARKKAVRKTVQNY